MQLFNLTTGKVLLENVVLADNFWQRLLGLMGKKALGKDMGLLLFPCSAVHTCFMRFPLDLVFLARDLSIVKIAKDVPSFRSVHGGKDVYYTLELTAGAAAELSLGDKLQIERM